MARYVNGRDFKLYVLDSGDYKLLACLTDCSFSISANKIPITSRSTGKWAAYDYTNLSWAGSASGVFFIQLVTGGITPFELTAKQINQQKPSVRFVLRDREGYGKQVQGDVVIDQMSFEGGTDDFAVFNLAFSGSGELAVSDLIPGVCFLTDSNGDLIIDSNFDYIVDGNCDGIVDGEFDAADFLESDFII